MGFVAFNYEIEYTPSSMTESKRTPIRLDPTSIFIKAIFILFIVLIFSGTDLVVKELAFNSLRGHSDIEVIPGFWSFRYSANDDIGFSLLRFLDNILNKEQKLFVLVFFQLAATIAVAIFYFFIKKWKYLLPLAFIVSGGLGNAINRIMRGAVIDYIMWYYGDFTWPIFNLADVYAVIGIFSFVIIFYFFSKEKSLKSLIRPKEQSGHLPESS